MATSLTLENDSSLAQGYLKVNGSTAATLTTSGITGNLTGNVTGSLTAGGSLTLATSQAASGTAVDFTGIPSWAKRITVMFDGVSTDGTGNLLIQTGSGNFDTTGYIGAGSQLTASSLITSNSTQGYFIRNGSSPNTISGALRISLLRTNSWVADGVFGFSNTTSMCIVAGSRATSGPLDRIRITTVNGTDAFDAGTINISYEG